MLLFGVISVIQIIFLPGFLTLNIFKIKTDSAIQKWSYIFSLSLFINYCLVMVLTLLSIYTFYSIFAILIFEVLAVIFFYRESLFKTISSFNFRTIFFKYFEFLRSNSVSDRIIIIISSVIILFYCAVFFANLGTIFYFVDTVNNYEWNRWAIDFAHNILPKYSSHFPQLIPANWSISYVMIGENDVHFFPKAIMPLFFIGNLLIFVDLALTKKNKIYFVGLIIYGLFAPIIYSLVFIADGNADLPVSFFAFLTFYSFIKISHVKTSGLNGENELVGLNIRSLKDYMLIFLFASMAAATKLAGFYTFTLTVFVLGIYLLYKKNLSKKAILKLIAFGIFISCFSLFWHLRAPEVMYSGLNQPQYLSPDGYKTIFIKALKLMYYNFGLPVFAFFIITITASLFHKKIRYISFVMVIVPTILWMFKYSADFRNLSFAVPFLSFCAAVGLFKLVGYKKSAPIRTNKEIAAIKITALKLKEKLLLISSAVISCIMFLIFISDKFYVFLSGIYEFINKYYFQSNRIVYFIESGLLLHVDFYERVFIALSIVIFMLTIFILTKLRLSIIILLFAVSVIFLNFTTLKKNNILKHQAESFAKVDARNYYQWIEMICAENPGSNIHTNFKPITYSKIPREINFDYLNDISKSKLKGIKKKNYYLFLKSDNLEHETRNFIELKIHNGYKLLLGDNNYIFFVVNPI